MINAMLAAEKLRVQQLPTAGMATAASAASNTKIKKDQEVTIMQALLRESVLWDINSGLTRGKLNILSSSSSSANGNNNDNSNTGAVASTTNAAAVAVTSDAISDTTKDARTSSSIPLVGHDLSTSRLSAAKHLTRAIIEEISIANAKQLITAYREPVSQLLAFVTSQQQSAATVASSNSASPPPSSTPSPETIANNAEIEKQCTTIRRIMLQLDDLFDRINVGDSAFSYSDLISSVNREVWSSIPMLMSAISTLATTLNIPFPADQWKRGNKIILSDSPAYNVPLKQTFLA